MHDVVNQNDETKKREEMKGARPSLLQPLPREKEEWSHNDHFDNEGAF